MRGILIALALVLVLAGAGVAGYVATKDDGGATPGSGDQLSDGSGSGPESGDGTTSPGSAGSATSPDSTDSTPAPNSGGTTSPTSPASPDSGTSSGGATSPASPGSSSDTAPSDTPPTPTKGSGKGGVITVPPARVFTGTGNKRLGTVNLRATSILRWRSKGHFEVRFGRQDFSIIAPTKSGQLIVPAFRFNRVRVVATGPWKITVTPQA